MEPFLESLSVPLLPVLGFWPQTCQASRFFFRTSLDLFLLKYLTSPSARARLAISRRLALSGGAEVLDADSCTVWTNHWILWASVSRDANGERAHAPQGLVWWLKEKIQSVRPWVLSLALEILSKWWSLLMFDLLLVQRELIKAQHFLFSLSDLPENKRPIFTESAGCVLV